MRVSTGKMQAKSAMPGKDPLRPTKLFIGGISRHTTTKQLRQHFSQWGRVLDCVAMRQPDGSSRGFGYVTLDSPAAAERCLSIPQVIDDRVVDMKAAVPEGSVNPRFGSSKPSPTEFEHVANTMEHLQPVSLHYNGIPPSFGGNVAGLHSGHPWWLSTSGSALGVGVDAVSRVSATGMQADGPLDCLEVLRGFRSTHTEIKVPSLDAKSMCADAPEFIPRDTTVSYSIHEPTSPSLLAQSPAIVAALPLQRTRAPLGELTNVVANDGNKSAEISTGGIMDLKPPGLLSHAQIFRSDPSVLEMNPLQKASDLSVALLDQEDSRNKKYDEHIDSPTSAATDCPEDPESDASHEADEITSKGFLENLPSVGSALHSLGNCRRCNFFPKGKCKNGRECTFCHFPHEKRKLSRQEKRERIALSLQKQELEELEEFEGTAQTLPEQQKEQENGLKVDDERLTRCSVGADVQEPVDASESERSPEELRSTSGVPAFLGLPPLLASAASLPEADLHAAATAALDLIARDFLPPGLPLPSFRGHDLLRSLPSLVPNSFPWSDDTSNPHRCTLPAVLATAPPSIACPMATPTISRQGLAAPCAHTTGSVPYRRCEEPQRVTPTAAGECLGTSREWITIPALSRGANAAVALAEEGIASVAGSAQGCVDQVDTRTIDETNCSADAASAAAVSEGSKASEVEQSIGNECYSREDLLRRWSVLKSMGFINSDGAMSDVKQDFRKISRAVWRTTVAQRS
eukprot:TRINITY_DN48795_c0_g1_i1.p1 TRINITY_DN48795_c0_g1~~TRINITY_DN48795_c0_g1_i1.p1  ORF type:complete len:745 (-),score=108.53 TRINITY_DN48795_c0_g1_i1:284-2518(-)